MYTNINNKKITWLGNGNILQGETKNIVKTRFQTKVITIISMRSKEIQSNVPYIKSSKVKVE